MSELRQRYQKIIDKLIDRIDEASFEYVVTGCPEAHKEYNDLAFELCEIKDAIKKSEERAKADDKRTSNIKNYD